MGLFSSKKETHVASTVYNLAGELGDRKDYLKTVTVGAVLSGSTSIAGSVQNALLNGPAVTDRTFFKWAAKNYDLGLPKSEVAADALDNPNVLLPHIPRIGDETIWIQSATMGAADHQYFAEKWLMDNRPNLMNKDWSSDVDDVNMTVVITFADNTAPITFMLPDEFNRKSRYIYAKFVRTLPGSTGLRIPGTLSPQTVHAANMPTKGYSAPTETVSGSGGLELKTRVQVITNYADERPRTIQNSETTRTEIVEELDREYTRTRYMGKYGTAAQTYSQNEWLYVFKRFRIVEEFTRDEVINVIDTVAVTEITNTTREVVEPIWNYRLDTQEVLHTVMGEPEVFIYRIGGPNTALNALKVQKTATRMEYFPTIPLRLDNESIDVFDEYDHIEKAYKKAMKSKLPDILEELDTNDSIDDIDFAFLVFGITLNEGDDSAKRYLYEYFKGLIPYQQTSKSEYQAWWNQAKNINKGAVEWNRWNDQQHSQYQSRYGDPEPARVTYPTPETSYITIDADHPLLVDFDLRYSWSYIHESVFAGKGKPQAKKGDIWLSTKTPAQLMDPTGPAYDATLRVMNTALNFGGIFDTDNVIYIYHQHKNLSYRVLEIVGLEHKNYVYNNKAVTIKAKDALGESDESGFIVPMHMPTLKKLTIVEQNQLANCNKLIVFNSYQIVKRRWYQRGFFKFLLAIAVVVVMFIFNPLSVAAAPGILGVNGLVGASLGFAAGSAAAAIAGAIANTIAAMIVTSLISKVSVDLFGDKWGAVVAAVASFVTMQYAGQYASTGNFAVDWSKIINVDNLMKITDPLANAYSGYARGEVMETMADIEKLTETYNEELSRIQELTAEMSTGVYIDPLSFTESTESYVAETRDTYIERTMLSGSDIADITTNLVSDYVDISLKLPESII